ncbi:hypothetical protein QUF80_01055 [Desulfococcaceae bacterium HSG8]|nr:hypothetical protein [Desulfococcaceae bacterium HSG8]
MLCATAGFPQSKLCHTFLCMRPSAVSEAAVCPHPILKATSGLSAVGAWQTFTMSFPLQKDIRLLCRLRPLSRRLAFSPPFQAWRCESSYGSGIYEGSVRNPA